MSRKISLDQVYENVIVDDFGEIDNKTNDDIVEQKAAVRPIHADWTIVDAFNVINLHAPKSRLGNELFVKCAEAFNYLKEQIGLSAVQSVVVAMLIEEGKEMTTRQMGKVLGLSNLSMMTYHNELEELFTKRWVLHAKIFERGEQEGYRLADGVVKAIRENRVFEAEVLECEDSQRLVEKLAQHFNDGFENTRHNFDDEVYWIYQLVEANETLPLCKEALTLVYSCDIAFFMMAVSNYFKYSDSQDESLTPNEIELVYPITSDFTTRYMQNGSHQLFARGFLQHKCEGGMADTNLYVVSDYVKNELLSDVKPLDSVHNILPTMRGMKSYKEITPKALFYNEKENAQIQRLGCVLSKEQLPIIQERLKAKGMRTGVCVLMHGYPGTGKTATVYELARQTGRNIIEVNVTDFKDKYVGESEAKLKKIFRNYRKLCENCETMPILLLNEGDAILSKRTENVERSIDQMANALQNILLEEMENLKGVMIVTTNLTSNLDKAFERRFIFKIQFEKPSTEVKAHIWQSMIDNLNERDANELASLYDVTGGEIENIARKSTMEYILTGKEADIDMLKSFTREEKLQSHNRKIIGFLTD